MHLLKHVLALENNLKWHSQEHPRTVGGTTARPAGSWFVLANTPRTQPEIQLSVDPRPDLRFVDQVTDRGSCA
ncbi:hypothetical protein MTR67_031322 [Solanum verrucosum]|uniref:Uncharacterized protein n=1 Tax=Solanum verrucosum TaxID=315347 RepID=A0AAF0ZET0_SOLVR|nr:hypothetical protein MTR67_031322 [Solanum verrucosum]